MSALEDRLAQQIALCGLPTPIREYRFSEGRRYRFDFCWRERHLALEVEGGIYGGRHVRPVGFQNDVEKYNLATLGNWRILRVTAAMIDDGRAIRLIEAAIGATSAAAGEEER